jgi:hypothetical protein
MARGRKRLIAGWGLVRASGILLVAILASRWIEVARLKSDNEWYLSLSRGMVAYGPFIIVNFGSIEEQDMFTRLDPSGLVWKVKPEVYGKTLVLDTPVLTIERPRGRKSAGAPFQIYIQFMLWPLALSAASLGTGMILWGKRRGSSSRDHCLTCGYDMKGLAAGAGCPECGKTAATR